LRLAAFRPGFPLDFRFGFCSCFLSDFSSRFRSSAVKINYTFYDIVFQALHVVCRAYPKVF